MGADDYDFGDFSNALDADRNSRTSIFWVAGILFVVFLVWLAASISGLPPWLGTLDGNYRDSRVQTTAADDEDLFAGFFGMSSFVFVSGQEVYVDYDVTLRRGAVQIIVRDHAGQAAEFRHMVVTSSSGTVTVPIARTDPYHISVEPTAASGAGQGYDVDIAASWGARWP